MSKIVIALGGNALQRRDSAPTAEAQLEVVRQTCEHIAEISASGYELAIVHGNGPQSAASCWPARPQGRSCRPCHSTSAAL